MDEHQSISLLEKHGIRPTANRTVVVRTLAAAMRPLSLSELEERIGTIDKSNIFRQLATFREHHLVHDIEDGSDSVRYELCLSHDAAHDDDMHVHFYCEQCHKTFCIDNAPIPPVELPDGYVPRSANYLVKGLCPDCAAKESGVGS